MKKLTNRIISTTILNEIGFLVDISAIKSGFCLSIEFMK